MTPSDAYLRLALVSGLGPIIAHRLLAAVEHPAEVFRIPLSELRRVDGIGGERARRIVDPTAGERVATERARAHAAGVQIITVDDPSYPSGLKALTDPPLALWVRGDLQERDRLGVAVIGPRKPSASGHRQARLLSLGLARLGASVVSGLARGIDTVAHDAALTANGRTIAVLGSGFDHLYPSENTELAARIADGHGAVISEYPLNTKPSPGTFPRRNRIVAAMSLATLVIEAGERSGALITARLAGELGRDVLALPGPVDRPEHIGSNRLLRDGATLVTNLDEIIEELAPLQILAAADDSEPVAEEHPRLASLNQRERQVYRMLDDTARGVDDLVRVSGLPASAVSATLLALELRKLARRHDGGYVQAT